MFTEFGRSRLNSGGDRRARLSGEEICSYIELPRSKLHKTGDLSLGWELSLTIIANILVFFVSVRALD